MTTLEEKNEKLISIKKMSLVVGFMVEKLGLDTRSQIGRELFFNSLRQIAGKSFVEVPQETLETYSEEEYLDYQIALWNFRLNEYIVKSIIRMEGAQVKT